MRGYPGNRSEDVWHILSAGPPIQQQKSFDNQPHSAPHPGYAQEPSGLYPVQPRAAWPPENGRQPQKLPPLEDNVKLPTPESRQQLPPLPDDRANFVGFRMIEERMAYMEQRLMTAERAAFEAGRSSEMHGHRVAALTADLSRSSNEASQLQVSLTGLMSELRGAEARLNQALASLADAGRTSVDMKARIAVMSDELMRANSERASMSSMIERLSHQLAAVSVSSSEQSRKALDDVNSSFREEMRAQQMAHMAEVSALNRGMEAYRQEAGNVGAALRSALERLNARIVDESAAVDRLRAEATSTATGEAAQLGNLRGQVGELQAMLNSVHQQIIAEQQTRRADAAAFQANMRAMETAAASMQEAAITRLQAAMESKGRELTAVIMELDGRLADKVDETRSAGEAQLGALMKSAAKREKVAQERLLVLESALRDVAVQSSAALAELQSKIDRGIVEIAMATESSRRSTDEREAALREQINAALSKVRAYARDMEESLEQERVRLEEVVKMEIRSRIASGEAFKEEMATLRGRVEKLEEGGALIEAARRTIMKDVRELLDTEMKAEKEHQEGKRKELQKEFKDLLHLSKKEQEQQRDVKIQEAKKELTETIQDVSASAAAGLAQTNALIGTVKKEFNQSLATASKQTSEALASHEQMIRDADSRMHEHVREQEARVANVKKNLEEKLSSGLASAAAATKSALADQDATIKTFKEATNDRLAKMSASTSLALAEQNARLQDAKQTLQENLDKAAASTKAALSEQDLRLREAKKELESALTAATSALSTSLAEQDVRLTDLKTWFNRNQVEAKLAEEALKLEIDTLAGLHGALEEKVTGLTGRVGTLGAALTREVGDREALGERVQGHANTLVEVHSRLELLNQKHTDISNKLAETSANFDRKLDAGLRDAKRLTEATKRDLEGYKLLAAAALAETQRSLKDQIATQASSQAAALSDLDGRTTTKIQDLDRRATANLASSVSQISAQMDEASKKVAARFESTAAAISATEASVSAVSESLGLTKADVEQLKDKATQQGNDVAQLKNEMVEVVDGIGGLKAGQEAIEAWQQEVLDGFFIEVQSKLSSLGMQQDEISKQVAATSAELDEMGGMLEEVNQAIETNKSEADAQNTAQTAALSALQESLTEQLAAQASTQAAALSDLDSRSQSKIQELDLKATTAISSAVLKLGAQIQDASKKAADGIASLETAVGTLGQRVEATSQGVEELKGTTALHTQLLGPLQKGVLELRVGLEELHKGHEALVAEIGPRLTAVEQQQQDVATHLNEMTAQVEEQLTGAMQEVGAMVQAAKDESAAQRAALEALQHAINEELTLQAAAQASALSEIDSRSQAKIQEAEKQLQANLAAAVKELEAELESADDRMSAMLTGMESAVGDVARRLEATSQGMADLKTEVSQHLDTLDRSMDAVGEFFDEMETKVTALDGKVTSALAENRNALDAGLQAVRFESVQRLADAQKTMETERQAALLLAAQSTRTEVEQQLTNLRKVVEASTKQVADMRTQIEAEGKQLSDMRTAMEAEGKLLTDMQRTLEADAKQLRADLEQQVVLKIAAELPVALSALHTELHGEATNDVADLRVEIKSEFSKVREDASKLTDEMAELLAEFEGQLSSGMETLRAEFDGKLAQQPEQAQPAAPEEDTARIEALATQVAGFESRLQQLNLLLDHHTVQLSGYEREVEGALASVTGPQGIKGQFSQLAKKLEETSAKLNGLKAEIVGELDNHISQKVQEVTAAARQQA